MKKNILSNSSIILFPIILYAVMYIVLPSTQDVTRNYISYSEIILRYSVIIFLLFGFLYLFFIMKKHYNMYSVIIGIIISICLLIPDVHKMISLDLYQHVSLHYAFYIVLFELTLMINLLLLIMFIKK